MAYLLTQDSSLKTNTAAMKSKIISLSSTISTDKGNVHFINNGITTTAS